MKCISIFKCNPQIEVLDKSRCSLEDVPNFQNYSRSLEELYLDANKLTTLNENVFKLTKLRRFSCSDNAIQDIPPDIAKLVNLVEIDCSRNKIQNVPEQIKFLRGLQVCDFSQNNIEYLPNGLVQLKNLTCLTLNYCPIKYLPEDIGLLKNLESLELRENELESLPDSITNLESLKKLDIGRNLITYLPEDIGRLSNLEYLLIDGNRLETVPPKIGRLSNLQCLDLSQQEFGLKYLPEEIGGLVSLTDLHLSENHLQTLPDGIGNLRSLSIFKVDNNLLSELNHNIGGCISLQELVLTANQITELPPTIGYLTDLRSLSVDSNLISKLPPQIGELRRLGIMTLRDNFISRFPNEIGNLEELRVLDVSGNRLEYLPVSLTNLSLKALWLSKNQAQPLPKLQIDDLPNNAGRVLTCYLLPQQSEDDDEKHDELANTGHEHYDTQRQAAVTFDTADIDDSELPNDVNFVRHDTPHPKELKARHQKLFGNAPIKPELQGHDNASFSMVDNPQTTRDDHARDQSGLGPAYRHMEYESNGLPEMPASVQKPGSRSQYYNNVAATVADEHTDRDFIHEGRHPYGNGVHSSGLPSKKDAPTSYLKDRLEREEVNNSPRDRCYVLDILVKRHKIHKPGLGLSIAGGKDTPPYRDNDEGIFVSKVTPGGPAEAAGVRVGDKILAVNNHTFYEGITHQKAVDIFKKVKPDCVEFTMRVLRDDEFIEEDQSYPVPTDRITSQVIEKTTTTSSNSTFSRTYTIPASSESNGTSNVSNLRQLLTKEPAEKVKTQAATLPPGLSLVENSKSKNNIIYTTLVKNYRHDLGLVLENRTDDASNWSNIVIADIKPNSIASRDGKLQIDDRLLSINGTDVTGIDLDRIMMILEGTERFIRIVVSRGDADDPVGAALRNMPTRPQLGSWFSSTYNMSPRPSLIESYQRPSFGSVSSLQKQGQGGGSVLGAKPPKPPKPTHLLAKDSDDSSSPTQLEDNPVAMPRGRGASENAETKVADAMKRAAWRRERLNSMEVDVEMLKMISEAQKRRQEEAGS